MQPDIETLIKIVIPAILLLIWVASNLFNRENPQKAAKDRAAALGNRPANYNAPARPPERRQAPPARFLQPNEEVMVIRAESVRPQPQSKQNQQGRRTGRTRPNNNQPQRRPEPTQTSRNRDLVGGALVADVNQSLTRPLELRSLSETMAAAPATTTSAAVSSYATDTSKTSSLDVRQILTNPARVREAFILNEVLQPPVSMRGRQR